MIVFTGLSNVLHQAGFVLVLVGFYASGREGLRIIFRDRPCRGANSESSDDVSKRRGGISVTADRVAVRTLGAVAHAAAPGNAS